MSTNQIAHLQTQVRNLQDALLEATTKVYHYRRMLREAIKDDLGKSFVGYHDGQLAREDLVRRGLLPRPPAPVVDLSRPEEEEECGWCHQPRAKSEMNTIPWGTDGKTARICDRCIEDSA